eukprot:947355-Rhodomonas_salina.1
MIYSLFLSPHADCSGVSRWQQEEEKEELCAWCEGARGTQRVEGAVQLGACASGVLCKDGGHLA